MFGQQIVGEGKLDTLAVDSVNIVNPITANEERYLVYNLEKKGKWRYYNRDTLIGELDYDCPIINEDKLDSGWFSKRYTSARLLYSR